MALFRSNTNPFQKYLNLNEQSPTLGFTSKWDYTSTIFNQKENLTKYINIHHH